MPRNCWATKWSWWWCLALMACQTPPPEKLPYLGRVLLSAEGDTLPLAPPQFELLDQYGVWVNTDSVRGQVLLVDFFFSSCPSICKDMLRNLRKVYAVYGQDMRLRIVSHSIDPQYDTPDVLAAYAQSAGVHNRNWLFLTGDETQIYRLALQDYMSQAAADSLAPGGFIHSGHLLLLDRQFIIRGIYDGTNDEEAARLLRELPLLLEASALPE
jgi:protein SCO1